MRPDTANSLTQWLSDPENTAHIVPMSWLERNGDMLLSVSVSIVAVYMAVRWRAKIKNAIKWFVVSCTVVAVKTFRGIKKEAEDVSSEVSRRLQ